MVSNLDKLVELTAKLNKKDSQKDNLISEIKQDNDNLTDWIAASTDGIWDWRIQENYEYMSPRFWEIFGVNPTTKKHDPQEWQGIIHQEDLPMVLANFDLHIKTKGRHPFYQEVRYHHSDGTTVWVICRGLVIEWDGEIPIRMVGTHTDVTNIKVESLAKTLAFAHPKKLLVPLACWDYRINTDVSKWNPLMYMLFEVDFDTPMTTKSYAKLIADEDRVRVEAAIQRSITTNTLFEEQYKLANGKTIMAFGKLGDNRCRFFGTAWEV